MGKSTSSPKKIKPSRDSSKLHSVKKKKKRTKRSKTKKIRRIKDYSDESESSGSDSSLYSSSDDDRRRRKRRSKVSKKRTRKRYSSSESDDDDDDDDDDETRLLKKKKKSKKKHEHVGKKKKKVGSRKKRRRDYSSSSTSSESVSIQDYQSDDGSEDDEKRRTKDRRRLGKAVSEEDNGPDECWQVEDEVMMEKTSRSLKSVIVVPDTFDNDDEREEEIVHDYDERKTSDDERYRDAIISEASKSSPPETSLKDDDLEAILKKRALENLKRFRRETQKSGIKASSVSEVEPLKIKPEKAQESQDNVLMEQKLSVSAESKDLVTSQVVNVKESGTVLTDLTSQQDQGDTDKVKTRSGSSSCSTKRKLRRPVWGQEDLNLANKKEAAGCKDTKAETIDKNCAESCLETTEVVSHGDIETKDEIKAESPSEEKTKDETKEESQYEQKTMTVMRGGELVQVSYKVYIPKKSSSLGRRKLKR